MVEVKIFPDSKALAQAAADLFMKTAEEALTLHGLYNVALSGGSTPQALYQILSSEEFASRINWAQIHLFWGDERCVPPDHRQSNYGKVREILLAHIPLPEENIHRIPAEKPPEQAAEAYEEELLAYFSALSDTKQCERAGFDLALLGMGSDGHTASLFPGTAAVTETTRWVTAHYIDKLSAWRITLTPALLNRSLNTVFMVTGEDKSDTLERVIYGSYQPERYPAQAIRPVDGSLTWLVDEAAAKRF